MPAIATFGVAIVFYSTSFGIGTDADSPTYAMAARSLLAGKGLTIQTADAAAPVPMTAFPPLLPLLLAVFGRMGLDPFTAARILNALLFGATIFLVGAMVKRLSGSGPASIFAALLMATVGLLAAWLPARKAAAIDPMEALRTE